MDVLCRLLAALLLSSVASADVTSFLKDGDAAFGRGEYSSAISLYTSAIELDDRSSLLYTKRAAAYIITRQQAQALRDLNHALEYDSSYVQGYIHRGKLHRQMCNFASAERDFNKVLDLKPGHATAAQQLSLVSQVQAALLSVESHFDAGEKAEARHALTQVFAEAQDCVQGQLLEAKLWFADEDYEQAIASTGRLLKSEPGHLGALVLRGSAYFYMFEHEIAKRHFGEALRYDPDYKDARTWFNKVKAFDRKRLHAERAEEESDWHEAANAFSEALHLDTKHHRANLALWAGLARCRAALHQWTEAVEAWDAVLALNPDSLDGKEGKIRALLGAERWQEAVAAARDAAQAHRGHQAFHHLYHEAEKRQKMALRKDYYKILGVSRDASETEVKRAYRSSAKVLHPDKVPESEKKDAEAKFRDLVEAYEVLGDSEKRARYDNGEDLNEQQHQGHGHHGGFHHGGFHQNFHFQWG